MPHQLSKVCCSLTASLFALCASAQTSPSVHTRLHLEEIARIALSKNFDASGAELSPSGSVLVWSRNQRTVAVLKRGLAYPICGRRTVDPISAAFTEGDSVIEVIDSVSRRVIQAGTNGRCVELAGRIPDGSVAAAHVPTGWYVASIDTIGEGTLSYRRTDEPAKWISVVDGDSPTGRALHLATSAMAAVGNRILISSLRSPFDWALYDSTGRVLARSDRALAIRLSQGDEIGWTLGLGVHALDSGFVEVLGDLRSDERKLALFDASGRFLRIASVPAPLGILHTLPVTRRLVVLRRLNTPELVIYSWRWQSP
jgi:hypothetical protein